MAATNAATSTNFLEPRFSTEHQQVLINSEEVRSRNREQLIEKLERVIQEKNASIIKLEEREQTLEDALRKKTNEFRAVEEQLRQFEEKRRTFEQLHQLQVQTFEKTIRDCQIENERLCEHINELTKQLREKTDFETIHQEKVLTFDRIAADTQLWRQKLDSYKSTIEERDETIANLKREINELQRRKQTNGNEIEENALRVQLNSLQNSLRDRDDEIERLKTTLRRVRDTLGPSRLSEENRWKSCSEDIGRISPTTKSSRSSSQRKRVSSPPTREKISSPSFDSDALKTKIRTLTERLENCQTLLNQRDEQIATLKRVHDKRWLRLKHLQKQYRILKDQFQSYTDDETNGRQRSSLNESFIRRSGKKVKSGCSVCQDQRARRQNGPKRKVLRQEDDDGVWNEIGKLRRENARLVNENLSLQEKIDLQEVEINEQTIVIGELKNELDFFNAKDGERQMKKTATTSNVKSTDDQQRLIEELDKKLYELETERTCLVFEHERLKTNLDLCINEKQHLIQQRNHNQSEMKKFKLRILALQDQIHKFRRNQLTAPKKNTLNTSGVAPTKRRLMKKTSKKKKKSGRKSCLEVLLDQNQSSTFLEDFHDQSLMIHRPSRHRTCSLCDHHTETSLLKRRRENLPISSTKKSRPTNPLGKAVGPTRISTLRKRLEQNQLELLDAKEENEQLHQRLSSTLTRLNILKSSNQRLMNELEKAKTEEKKPTLTVGDSFSSDGADQFDNLYTRLKNTSFDAARQRKLNKTLQSDNENLTKNLQSLTEKLTHTERDIASKRTLIENYKTRLNELETNSNRSNEKTSNENDDERLKSLTETMEKLRISLESSKNRLQAVTREKQNLETRYGQLLDDHQKLKTRFDDIQSKYRSSEQQIRQLRSNSEQLSQDLIGARRSSEQQLLLTSSKTQEVLTRLTTELERARRRLSEYERFINSFINEMIRRSVHLNENLQRAREHQRHRESLSTTLPGFDTALSTAGKILNLTQDDLDDIMSTTDDSFQTNGRTDSMDKNEKIRQKVSKLLISQEESAGKLLKLFSKKLDEIQAADRQLAMIR